MTETQAVDNNALVSLDEEHNNQVLVFSIPNEVMAMVFECGYDMQHFSVDTDSLESESDEDAFSDDCSSHSDSSDSSFLDSSSGQSHVHHDVGFYRNASFEVIVSHVCRLWRHITTTTPRLWSRITAAIDLHPDEVRNYLARSQGYPITVRFTNVVNPVRVVHNLTNYHLMVDQMFDHVWHWCRCTILVKNDCDSLALRLFSLHAPLLRHLTVAVQDVPHPSQLTPDPRFKFVPQILTGGAPLLNFVRLGGICINFFRPPLSNITTLHLEQYSYSPLPLSYQRFSEIITASPSLAHLSVYGEQIRGDWPKGQPLIALPTLRSLRMGGFTSATYSGMLLGIHAPGLISLFIKDLIDSDLEPFWEEMPLDKFPNLSSLSFFDVELAYHTYCHIFDAFPHIKSFATWQDSNVSEPTVLKILAGIFPDQPQPPWPGLEVLSACYKAQQTELLQRVVTTRLQMHHPLKKIRLLTGYDISKKSALQEMQVDVERLRDHDQWPPGLSFVDEDDQCFDG